jgi:hypothetical protein
MFNISKGNIKIILVEIRKHGDSYMLLHSSTEQFHFLIFLQMFAKNGIVKIPGIGFLLLLKNNNK